MRSPPLADLVYVSDVPTVGVLTTTTGAEVQTSASHPDPATPSRVPKRRRVLHKPGVGNVLGVVGGDVILHSPVDLDTSIWPNTVYNDHPRALDTGRRFSLDGASASSVVIRS